MKEIQKVLKDAQSAINYAMYDEDNFQSYALEALDYLADAIYEMAKHVYGETVAESAGESANEI